MKLEAEFSGRLFFQQSKKHTSDRHALSRLNLLTQSSLLAYSGAMVLTELASHLFLAGYIAIRGKRSIIEFANSH